MNPNLPSILIIAGSDSIGGAGVQQDVTTAQRLHVWPTTAVTAITAQNFHSVSDVMAVTPGMITAQLNAILSDLTPKAIKIGMLPNEHVVRAVADFIHTRCNDIPVVVDPIISSTSGTQLADNAAASEMARLLFPAAFVTPNIPEAEFFLQQKQSSFKATHEMAFNFLMKYKCHGVLLKGGHTPASDECSDYFAQIKNDQQVEVTEGIYPRVPGISCHGTGCALSTAFACYLVMGLSPEMAARNAQALVATMISQTRQAGFSGDNAPLLGWFLQTKKSKKR